MKEDFEYLSEQFADIKILRYRVDDFEKLNLNDKILVYCLGQAALCGRDILWDQNCKYNMQVRKALETIYLTYGGDRNTSEFKDFTVYFKRILFSNGIHHHYSTEKIQPNFSRDYFKELINESDLAKEKRENTDNLTEIIFDKNIAAKRVVLEEGKDIIASSANNYYEGVTQKEAEDYYSKKKREGNEKLSYGINSTLVKENGKLKEDVWRIGGKYSEAIEKIVYHLNEAVKYAKNEQQEKIIKLLIEFYTTGDLQTFDDYSIEWVKELSSPIDFINGFIEVYGDPLAYKGSWESTVQIKDEEATKRTLMLAENAQWFEDNSPVDKRFKKDKVAGVSAKVINVAMLGGDCYPYTPIGINLPNAEWIREEYGSKSVTIENITYSYNMASLSSGMLDEFAYSDEEKQLAKKWGYLGGNLHTDLHECLGHGSGKLLQGVGQDALKNYHSTIEEARADLFALYYIADKKMTELGIVPDKDVAKSEYNSYIRNGLMTQLTRIEPGKDLEESHMRNRQIIAKWVYEKGQKDNVIERITKDCKTYFVINDYSKLRDLFGKLLAEVQRIKSEGDYDAAKKLVESYGVKIDRGLHEEVTERFKKLNIAPYAGFLNPNYEVFRENGKIKDVLITYPNDFMTQMLKYNKEYSFL